MRRVTRREDSGSGQAEGVSGLAGPESSPHAALRGAGGAADILALQQAAGNRAVTGMLGAEARRAAPALQRRAVEQDDALSADLGVARSGNQQLVGLGWDVDIYSSDDAPSAASRLDALRTAGQRSGAVANRVAAHYTSLYLAIPEKQRKALSPTRPWTNDQANLRKAALPQIDPFFLELTCGYQQDEEEHDLTLRFQHGERLSGYVTSVRDTGNPSTGEGVSLVDQPHALPDVVPAPADVGTAASGENPLPVGDVSNVVDPTSTKYTKYGTSHEEEGSENILEQTSGAEEKSFDAYTKLAGEGGRWESVRKHGAYLKNTSRFFVTKADDASKVLAVEFRKLWKAWNSKFKKQYNIPDAVLAQYLRAGHPGYVVEAEKSAMGDDDYDVDAGRPLKEVQATTEPTKQ